ncbi:MAG: alpha-galactosidase [Candidatus Borkfalkiaceae bacterium]|nr:alpha-galactosidase [Christensenellaceae bacterium]
MSKKIIVSLSTLLLAVSIAAAPVSSLFPKNRTSEAPPGLTVLPEEEIVNASGWKIAQYEYRAFLSDLNDFPVSFVYGGKTYRGFDEDFSLTDQTTLTEGAKESTTTVLRHRDEFTVTIESALYVAYGAYEWTLRFENTGDTDTAIFEKVNGCDLSFAGTNPHLKGLLGDQFCQYYPYDYNLLTTNLCFSTSTGRSNEEYMPYFNLETDSGGALLALGWPGNWEAEFNYSEKKTAVSMRQKNLRTYLKPGETFRSPLTAVVRYGIRNEDLAMNAWRRWYVDCNMPKDNGEQIKPQSVMGSSSYTDEMVTATDDLLTKAIRTFAENGIRFDYWWMDAGWYVKSDKSAVGSWMEVGTWEVDVNRFPSKLSAVSDYAHSVGTKTLLWFEPETIRVDLNGLIENFGFRRDWAIPDSSWGNAYLVDFANPDFRKWLTDRVNTVLKEGNIDRYREDFNVRPATAWASRDETDRVGLYENQYLCAHLAFWDDLIESNPGMVIDSCASGGNRNDLESMRRAIPMHVSDSAYGEAGAKQSMFYQLFKWLPYFGHPTTSFSDNIREPDVYAMRSNYCASFNMHYYYELKDEGYQKIYDCLNEYRKISQYLYADYYPITEYSRGENAWMGWEFFDEDKQAGYVQLFRQESCGQSDYLLKLKGVSDDALYVIRDFDGVNTFTGTGRELKSGVTVTLSEARSAYVAVIEKIS